MPTVNPGSSGSMPSDWRWAWQEFQALKAAAQKARINTSQWKLIYPSRVQRIVDPRWKMVYTSLRGTLTEVYLGSTGRLAGDTIRKMIPEYARQAKVEQTRKPRPKPKDPLFDEMKVREAFATLNRELKAIRSLQDQRKFEVRFPNLIKMMNRKAGILDMNLQQYLTSHPHSILFPTPPRTEAEYAERKKSYERWVKARDEGRKQQKEAHGSDWNPTY